MKPPTRPPTKKPTTCSKGKGNKCDKAKGDKSKGDKAKGDKTKGGHKGGHKGDKKKRRLESDETQTINSSYGVEDPGF